MRFYWLKDRQEQGQFNIHWEPGKFNLADYPTKHHYGSHHRKVRPIYLFEGKDSPSTLQGCNKILVPGLADDGQTRATESQPTNRINRGMMTSGVVNSQKHRFPSSIIKRASTILQKKRVSFAHKLIRTLL
jgi:hypothetical protein